MKTSSAAHLPAHLTVGSQGPAVLKLEEQLKASGYLHGKADDRFDSATHDAVKQYKQDHGFKVVNGRVGNFLWHKFKLGAGHDGETTTVPTTSSTGKSSSFSTVTFNVKSNPVMSQTDVLHDVHEASKQGSVIGWNEIGPDRYFDAIKSLGPDWGHYMPMHGHERIPDPISWKKSEWKLEDEGYLKTHNGKAKISPNRYVTWVKLQNRETGQSIIRMNTHVVSGAWNQAHTASDPWRQEMWGVHMDKMKHLIGKLEQQGCPIIVGGDFNRNHYKVLGNEVKYDNNIRVGTHGGATLDYLMHTPSKDLKAEGFKIDKNTRSDHDAVIVKYEIRG